MIGLCDKLTGTRTRRESLILKNFGLKSEVKMKKDDVGRNYKLLELPNISSTKSLYSFMNKDKPIKDFNSHNI